MTSLNAVKPGSSIAAVAVATNADETFECAASPKLRAWQHVNSSVWSVAITLVGARRQYRCPSPVVQVPERNRGSGRVNGPESHNQLRRVSSARWHAHLSSVGKSPFEHCRFATTRARLRSLRSPESCETQLMPNALLAHHRTGPNPALKRNASSVARRPSSAGPSAHFALAVQRATLLASA